VRIGSAFFKDTVVNVVGTGGVQYTIGVPFERFIEVKALADKGNADAVWMGRRTFS